MYMCRLQSPQRRQKRGIAGCRVNGRFASVIRHERIGAMSAQQLNQLNVLAETSEMQTSLSIRVAHVWVCSVPHEQKLSKCVVLAIYCPMQRTARELQVVRETEERQPEWCNDARSTFRVLCIDIDRRGRAEESGYCYLVALLSVVKNILVLLGRAAIE